MSAAPSTPACMTVVLASDAASISVAAALSALPATFESPSAAWICELKDESQGLRKE